MAVRPQPILLLKFLQWGAVSLDVVWLNPDYLFKCSVKISCFCMVKMPAPFPGPSTSCQFSPLLIRHRGSSQAHCLGRHSQNGPHVVGRLPWRLTDFWEGKGVNQVNLFHIKHGTRLKTNHIHTLSRPNLPPSTASPFLVLIPVSSSLCMQGKDYLII